MTKKSDSRILEIIAENAECDIEKLNNRQTSLLEIGYDSISIIRLQVDIEDTFGFMFDPIEDDFDAIFSTIGSIVDCVTQKAGKEEN